MKFLSKILSKIIGSELNEYLDIVNSPDKASIDKIKEVIRSMEKRYKSDISGVLKTHYPEMQKLYFILGEKLEQQDLCDDAIKAYSEVINLNSGGYPPLTKDAKKKVEQLKR